jgi:fucose 4-O-acetylase-like acetyltransferase
MNLAQTLAPIANFFSQLGIPPVVVHWGHPFFMSIVIFIMGSFAGYAGWRGRVLATIDSQASIKSLGDHRKTAPLMALFLALGYTGGLLSMTMQEKPLLESPHFWTGSLILALLTINGSLSLSGFGGNQPNLRKVHAYIGSGILGLMFFHAMLGLKLGISI